MRVAAAVRVAVELLAAGRPPHGNGSAKKATVRTSLSWRTNGFLAASCASVALRAIHDRGAIQASSSSSEG